MEKRLYERITLPIRLVYEIKNRPKVLKETVTKNLSGGGICISLREKLFPKTEISMKVEIGSNKNVVTMTGRVVWTRRVEVGGDLPPNVYYDTGIEFIDANPININGIITHFHGRTF